MSRRRVAVLLAGAALIAAAACAQERFRGPGSPGRPFGPGRRPSRVALPGHRRLRPLLRRSQRRQPLHVALANRTGERLGVVLTVDGLNAISGERDAGLGRMYVLDPWQSTRSRAGARRCRTCGSSRSSTSVARMPPAPARPTRRWAGSRSPCTASAVRTFEPSPTPYAEPPASLSGRRAGEPGTRRGAGGVRRSAARRRRRSQRARRERGQVAVLPRHGLG